PADSERGTPTPSQTESANQSDKGRRRVSRVSCQLPAYRRPPWVKRLGAFSLGQPAMNHFPVKIWANLVARHARKPAERALEYGDPMGLKELRDVIAVYLRTSRAVRCDPAQILIVSGSQQALDLSVRTLVNPSDSVWVEEPGYWLAWQVLTAAGCR